MVQPGNAEAAKKLVKLMREKVNLERERRRLVGERDKINVALGKLKSKFNP